MEGPFAGSKEKGPTMTCLWPRNNEKGKMRWDDDRPRTDWEKPRGITMR